MHFRKSNICANKLNVQETDSSTEAEIISLDAGLRMDGLAALGLWDLVIEVFHSSPNQINKSKDQEPQGNLSRNSTLHMKNQNSTKHAGLDLSNVDHVLSNVRPSRFGAMLHVFEDKETAIKMIIKGRTTTLQCDKAVEITNAKTYVFSDSVLCLGGISDQPVEAWKNKIQVIWKLAISKICLESMESRWSSSGKYSQDSLRWAFSKRFNNL